MECRNWENWYFLRKIRKSNDPKLIFNGTLVPTLIPLEFGTTFWSSFLLHFGNSSRSTFRNFGFRSKTHSVPKCVPHTLEFTDRQCRPCHSWCWLLMNVLNWSMPRCRHFDSTLLLWQQRWIRLTHEWDENNGQRDYIQELKWFKSPSIKCSQRNSSILWVFRKKELEYEQK